MKWTGRAKMPKFDAGVRWLDSGMFWLSWVTEVNEASAMMCPQQMGWLSKVKKLYCAMWVSFSPFLPWLLHQPVDGEGEEVVEEDEDAEAEQEEVDDHLDSPPSAANSPPASASWRGFAFLESRGSTGTVQLHRRRILKHTLSIHTHSLTNSIFVYFCWRENIFKIYPLHSHTQR